MGILSLTATLEQGRRFPNICARLIADAECRDKIKGYGKLKVVGSLEGTELEIYGNLSINGYLYVTLR
jgi:hypothetical protein